jgi:hypothetical protein
LPQRQIGPVSSTSTWPISPAIPPPPRYGPAVDDEARADAGGDHHVDGVAGVARGAQRDLGERAQVGVVVEVDREVAEAAAHLGGHREALPAGQDRGRADGAAVVVDRARERHADADHVGVAEAGLGEQLVDELGGGVERVLGVVVDVLGPHRLGEHGAREVGDGGVDAVVAEVDADHRARRAVEREQRRRAARGHAGRGVRVRVLDDQPVRLEVGDQAGDRGTGQAGDPCDLGTARRPALAQGFDDAQAIQLAQRFQRPSPHSEATLSHSAGLCQEPARTRRSAASFCSGRGGSHRQLLLQLGDRSEQIAVLGDPLEHLRGGEAQRLGDRSHPRPRPR